MSRRKKNHGIRWRSIFIWHRYLGFTAALFVIILALTGILLNHSDKLELDERHVKSSILLSWYGVSLPTPLISFNTGKHWISQLGNRLYFNQQQIIDTDGGMLTGAVMINNRLVISFDNQLLLLTQEGELIDRLDQSVNLPQAIQAIGRNIKGELILLANHNYYTTDIDLLSWSPRNQISATWATPQEPPQALYDSLVNSFRGKAITLERLFLDIHSGRILGQGGVYLVDVAAVLFLLLAATGIWVFVSRKRK